MTKKRQNNPPLFLFGILRFIENWPGNDKINNMELILYPNKILREKCEEVKEFDESLDKVVLEMLNIMYKKTAWGLPLPKSELRKESLHYLLESLQLF